MEKIDCKKCGKLKDISEFSKTKNRKRGFHTWCKDCVKAYDQERHQRLKEKILKQKKEYRSRTHLWYNEYKKTLKCEKCEDARPYVLTFHHKEGKDFNVSDHLSNGISIERLKKEISKCKVLCANCHLEEHFLERAIVQMVER